VQVQLQDVQSFYQEDGKSPFKHMPWKHGSMHNSYEQVRRRPATNLLPHTHACPYPTSSNLPRRPACPTPAACVPNASSLRAQRQQPACPTPAACRLRAQRGQRAALSQVGADLEVCKLAEVDYSSAYHGVIGVFACNSDTDVPAAYRGYQQAVARVAAASGAPVLAARLFGAGSEAAVQRCQAAVRADKKMEGLVAMEQREIDEVPSLRAGGCCMCTGELRVTRHSWCLRRLLHTVLI
jgi:hypothetical protein